LLNATFSNISAISWRPVLANVSNVYSNTLSLIYILKKKIEKKEDSAATAATATNCITVTGAINTNILTKHVGYKSLKIKKSHANRT
jgi:purine-cytosine permease-like protein